MSGPFSRKNPFDREPTELSSRWSFFKTKQQQLKDKRDAERRQAMQNQNALLQQQNFNPTPISNISTDNLFEGAQSEALIAQANANNPNPALREESRGWFGSLMEKWDDKTVQMAGNSLNPFNAVIDLYNPSAAREIELKRKQYKKEYITSGMSDKEAQKRAQRAAWRETEISKVRVGGTTIDPVKFMGEVLSDPTNFIFFGAGIALKGGVKGVAKLGRSQLQKTGGKFADIGKGKMGNTADMVLEDELVTNPGFYWQKQHANNIDKTFFKGSSFKDQIAARKAFRKYMYNPEKLNENSLRKIYEDPDIANALSRYKNGEISTESYSRKITFETFEELYKAPIVKSNKNYLSNPKSDYQYLALQGTANSADYITDLKAVGYAIASTESKLLAPLRFGWKYLDPAPFQVNSKLGRALLIHGARENDNKVLVANALRKQKEEWGRLDLRRLTDNTSIDINDLPEVGAFDSLINPNYNFAAKGESREALDYWGTFLEEAFVDDGKGGFVLAAHIKANKVQEKALRNIVESWGEHGIHMVENGILSPKQIGLEVLTKADGTLMYQQDRMLAGKFYVGSMVESIGDKQLRGQMVSFSKASGERSKKYISDFKKSLDDEIGDLTREDARKMGIKYLNDPLSVYDFKSGEVMDRINDTAFVNRMKILGDKRFQTTDDYISTQKKINDIQDTFDSITKSIQETTLNPKLQVGNKKFVATAVNEFSGELKTVLQNIDNDLAPEVQNVTNKMLEVLDGPMNQRARQLENVESELRSIVSKMQDEGAVISELRNTLNRGLAPIPALDLEKSTRSRIQKVLGGASHRIMQGTGEFDADTLFKLKSNKTLEFLNKKGQIIVGQNLRKSVGGPVGARKIVLPKNIDELRQLRKDLKEVQQKMITGTYSKAVIANVNETEKAVYKLIKDHNATSKLKVDRKQLDPIKDILSKLDELQLDSPLVVQKVKNEGLFKNLNDLIKGYSNSPARAISDKFKLQLIKETKVIVNTLDDSIASKSKLADELLDRVGPLSNNPELAKKYFGNYFTKKGVFRQSVMKEIDMHFPAVSDILVKFQQDPKYLNEYQQGLNNLQEELLPQVQKALSKHHEELKTIKYNFYKEKNPVITTRRLRGQDAKGIATGKVLSTIENTQRMADADLVNVNLRNGIPTKELENYLFTNADKKRVEAFFGQVQGKGIGSKFSALLETTGAVGDVIRVMKVGYDFGAPLIQGLPLLVMNPAGWGRATGLHYKTFFQSKEAVAGYMAKNSHVIDEMIETGIEISGEGLDYYSAFKDGTLFSQVLGGVDTGLSKVGLAGVVEKDFGLAGITQRFNESFDVFGDIARIEMYSALKDVAIKKSIGSGIVSSNINSSNKVDNGEMAMMQLADTVNKMTGVFSSRARGATRSSAALDRSWAFFSPRYTRASTALIADALMGSSNNISGYAARHTLFKMLGVGMMSYVAQVELRRQIEEEQGVPEEQRTKAYLDPRPVSEGGDGGKFMKIRLGSKDRESYVGVGGFWTSFLKAASNISLDSGFRGDKSDSPLFMTDEVGKGTTGTLLTNPIVQWLRGRQPPTAGLAWDYALGHDFIGNPLETKTDWGKHLSKQAVPFWVEHGFMSGDDSHFWDRPAGMFAEMAGFAANEVSDWQNLQDLKDELSMKHHGVMWEDLPILQQEEIKMSTVGSSDDIQVIEDKIYEERKQYPLGDKAQQVMPEWFRTIDEIQGEYDNDAQAVTSALNGNEIDVSKYIEYMNSLNRKRRLSQQDLKKQERYKPLYKNFEYQTIDKKTGVADYFFNEYMNLISDNTQFSLLPTSIQGLGFTDSDMIDWDAKDEAIGQFEGRVGPEVMQYINQRMTNKPRVGNVPHPVYEEYLRGRENYLTDYYQRVEQEALAIRGDESIELWNAYKRATYPVREEIEKTNPMIKQILRDITKARQLLRKNNPDLDAFLYRFNIGGTSTLLHSYNKSDYRKGELAQPFPMERYTPGFTTD